MPCMYSYFSIIAAGSYRAHDQNQDFEAAILIGIFSWAGLHSAVEFTNSLEFCISCHELDRVYAEYRQSPHYKNAAGVRAVCAGCHGRKGLEPTEMPPLGKPANKNPWEIIQKIQNGQPDEPMPTMRAFDMQVSVDILSYLQTLPRE